MRLNLSIALGVGLVCVGITGLMQRLAWEKQRERMASTHIAAVSAAVSRLERALVLPVWNLDVAQVRQLVEAELTTGSHLREVWIEMSANEQLRAVSKEGLVNWSTAVAPSRGMVARPIAAPHVDRQPAGGFAVLDDDAPLRREFEARRNDAILLSALTGLAAALAAGLLSARLVNRRTASLANSLAAAPEAPPAEPSADRLDNIAGAAEVVLARLTGILGAFEDGIITAGPDDLVQRVNPAAAALLASPAPGQPLRQVLAALTGAQPEVWEPGLAAGGYEWTRAGRVLLATRHPLAGPGSGTLVLVRDLTALRVAGTALATQRAQLQSIIDHAPAMIFAKDLAGRILFVNRYYETVMGTPAAAVAGATGDRLFPPELAASYALNDQNVIASGMPLEFDEEVETNQGRRTYQSVKFPLRDPEGRVWAVCGIALDVTAARSAERERQAMAERLRHAEKLQVVGQLAGGVAHDFNNHLAAIQGFAELLATRIEDERQRRWCANITTSTRRASELTRSLLRFARRGETSQAPLSVATLLTETANLAERLVGQRVRLVVDTGPPGLVVPGDVAMLQNALLNLLINGRDAMPAGGQLNLSATVEHIDAARAAGLRDPLSPGAYVAIRVADTGTGMSVGVSERIFEPFFTTKGPGSGTGLGLASVRGTVIDHRGTIEVETAPGRGSTFIILLPQSAEVARNSSAQLPAVRAAARLAGLSILVIDDEAPLRELLATALAAQGAEVRTAGDGREGIQQFAAKPCDWVLLDMRMPGMDGGAVFAEVRRLSPGQRVVVISGYAEESALAAVMEAGATAHLAKPFAVECLVDLLAAPQGSPARA